MEKNTYEILRKNIHNVELVSLTSHNWYDYNHNLVPWDEFTTPKTGDTVYNISGSTAIGYYEWLGSTWTGITNPYEEFILPIYLENTINDLGVLVGWDGQIEQVEQLCNFTYSGATGSTTVTISNAVNPDKLRTIVNQVFTIKWGDGTTSSIGSDMFSQVSHFYPLTGGTYEVSIFLNSTWTNQILTKTITVPFDNPSIINDEFGTILYFPEWWDGSGLTQNYLNELDVYTGETSGTTFTYVAFGGSKLDQKKLYGSTGYTPDVIVTSGYTEYVIDGFTYRDDIEGFTMVTGTTVGIPKEEIPNLCVTRNEHFIGFVDEPIIYSDIFVERGKQGVMEKNLRLSEIDNIGELEIYGNGYFNIRKQ